MHCMLGLLALYATGTSAHGLITKIQGANGVVMPGLSVIDGTPRDCSSPFCGSEDDTTIIRDFELGGDDASALGRNGKGPIDAAEAVSTFMGGSSGANKTRRGFLDSLLGGGDSSDDAPTSDGSETAEGTSEDIVAKTAGKGATSGLPTASDDGVVSMTFHQVNADGAGPLIADIDPTSGGTDTSAFQPADMKLDIPGNGLSLSLAQTTDFPIQVQMPAGMTCKGTVAGVKNVCVVRVHNSALAGPFGGSAAFTQSAAGKKRAVQARRLSRRRFARGQLANVE